MNRPCLSCASDIRPRQQGVQCDWCRHWQHRTCGTGVSQETYRMAMKNGGLTFVCRPCIQAETARDETSEPAKMAVTKETLAREVEFNMSFLDDTDTDCDNSFEAFLLQQEQEKLEQEREELNFNIDMSRIKGEQPFLIGDIRTDGQRHCLFATDYQLFLLKQSRRLFMGRTSKVVGEPFDRRGQLMSIHAFIRKNGQTQQLPLVFCLMSRCTTEDYVMVLRALLEKAGPVEIQAFMTDFDIASWTAIRSVFPDVEMKGCAYRWSQDLWKRVQKAGLTKDYKQRTPVGLLVSKLLVLKFLPAEHIKPTFEWLAKSATTPATRELFDGVRKQWIESPVFTLRNWSVYGHSVRTNNAVEGWHRRLNARAGWYVLDFYEFVALLQREAAWVKLAASCGILESGKAAKTARMDKALDTLWKNYADRSLSTSQFLKDASELYGKKV